MSKLMPLKPRMSEKAYGLSEQLNTYVFVVPTDANKATVTQAVSEQFKVTVADVRLMNVKGKVKTWRQKRARPTEGKRADIKKAYVSLKKGDKIRIFGEEEKKSKKKTAKDIAKPKTEVKQPEVEKKVSGFRRAFGRSSRQVQNKGGGGK